MTFFYKFWKKARVYYTLSISRGGGGPGPRAPPPGFATDIPVVFDQYVDACILILIVSRTAAVYLQNTYMFRPIDCNW